MLRGCAVDEGDAVEGARRRRRVFERPRGFDPGAVRTIRDERLEATPRRARASPCAAATRSASA